MHELRQALRGKEVELVEMQVTPHHAMPWPQVSGTTGSLDTQLHPVPACSACIQCLHEWAAMQAAHAKERERMDAQLMASMARLAEAEEAHRHASHAMPHHAMPHHAMPCHTMPCHATPCHAMPHHATPCHTVQSPADDW